DQHAAAAPRLGRAQDEKVGRIFDLARRVARRFVEIDDSGVFRCGRIEGATRHAPDANISAGAAIRFALSKWLGSIDCDPGDWHARLPQLAVAEFSISGSC